MTNYLLTTNKTLITQNKGIRVEKKKIIVFFVSLKLLI